MSNERDWPESVEPTKEELEEMAEEQARLDAEANNFGEDDEHGDGPEAPEPAGSYDHPFKCEDDLPANVFATIQTALAGRSTLTESERIDLIERLEVHGLALNRIEFPHPTAPHYLLHIVSSLPRPTTGCYIY